MATNEVFRDADLLSLPVPDGTLSGAPVRVGAAATGLNGVTQTKEGEGGNADNYASVMLKGAHKLPVSTTTTLAVMDPVYITSGNVLTPSASGNQLFGHALTAKPATANAIVTVRVAN
jgi:predicted RecA/RadA family phage recombinase